VQGDAISEDRTWVENDTWKELAIATNFATGHERHTPMQMASGSDRAISIDRNASIDECLAIHLGRWMDRRTWVDSVRPFDDHGGLEPFTDSRERFVRIADDDLRD
jgi:hypothetical protein